MIHPPGVDGVAFTQAGDGDQVADAESRRMIAAQAGISQDWATVVQVHGSEILEAHHPGELGAGDGLWTEVRALPIAVFTADCFAVVLVSDSAVGVAHAGWRGLADGVVTNLLGSMAESGHHPTRAMIGPGIGACCFEVGHEVSDQFPSDRAQTTWGSTSVDLLGPIRAQLGTIDTYEVGGCTRHQDDWFSHRRDRTAKRLAAIAWRP